MKTITEVHAPTRPSHTPGPWQITDVGCAIVGNNGGTIVVETGLAFWENLAAASAQSGTLANHHIPEVMANARLIAAAPEMMAALEALCADKYLADPINADRMRAARAAIAKAKGGAL